MNGSLSHRIMVPDDPVGKLPMHPEDYAALLEWVRAKERWDPGFSPEPGR